MKGAGCFVATFLLPVHGLSLLHHWVQFLPVGTPLGCVGSASPHCSAAASKATGRLCMAVSLVDPVVMFHLCGMLGTLCGVAHWAGP